MTEQEIERDMYARAVALIEERYPTGWGGAAVLRAEDGRCFTSVALENANLYTAVQNGMKLVVETGCSGSILNSANLPGAPTYSSSTFDAYPEADDIEIPAGSPILTGPGIVDASNVAATVAGAAAGAR